MHNAVSGSTDADLTEIAIMAIKEAMDLSMHDEASFLISNEMDSMSGRVRKVRTCPWSIFSAQAPVQKRVNQTDVDKYDDTLIK